MNMYEYIEHLKKRIAKNPKGYIKEALDKMTDAEIERIADDLHLLKKKSILRIFGKSTVLLSNRK